MIKKSSQILFLTLVLTLAASLVAAGSPIASSPSAAPDAEPIPETGAKIKNASAAATPDTAPIPASLPLPASAYLASAHTPISAPQEDAFTAQFNKAMLTVFNARTPEDLENAADEFLAALSVNPSNFQVNYNLGLIFLQLDDYARAVDFFQNCLPLAPSPEQAALASGYLNRARLLQQQMDRTLKAMLNPASWNLIEYRPSGLDTSWFTPEFRLSKNGQLEIKNPRLNYSPLDREPETKRHPWLPVTLKGRFFEFVVCLARQRACEAGRGYCLIQGEIKPQQGRTMAIVRLYVYNHVSEIGKMKVNASRLQVFELF